MNRTNTASDDTAPAGRPGTPSSAFPRSEHRPDEARFDAVAFRQSANLVRTLPEPPPAALAAAPARRNTANRRNVGSTYVAIWAGLGIASAAYLGALSWQRMGNIDMALAPVTESLERLATDVAELKQATAVVDARERATASRVTAVETRIEGFSQSAASLPQAPGGQRPTSRSALAEQPAATPTTMPATTGIVVTTPLPARIAAAEPATEPLKPSRQITTVTAPVPPVTAKVMPAPVARTAATTAVAAAAPVVGNPIQTGSLPPPAPTRPVGLLVASGPSLDSIRLSWTVLNQNHSAVLGSLDPRIVPSSDGSAFQLIAGPFASEAEAQKACTALKSRGVGCKAADYTGAPL